MRADDLVEAAAGHDDGRMAAPLRVHRVDEELVLAARLQVEQLELGMRLLHPPHRSRRRLVVHRRQLVQVEIVIVHEVDVIGVGADGIAADHLEQKVLAQAAVAARRANHLENCVVAQLTRPRRIG